VRVAAVEVLVMAATVGLAVGLSRTPTPATTLGDTSRAADLLGFSLPPAPDAARLALGWLPDGFAITFLVVAGGLYAAGLRALSRRGDRWPVGRTLAWYAGLLVFAWSTIGGLGLYSHVLFSAHMVAHMTLSMIAPIGLVLGAPITLALRALPGRRVSKERGLRQQLQQLLQSRVVQLLSQPLVAAGLFVLSLYGLYFTSLFGVLMANHLGHVLMELHFLAVGFLFFWVLVGVDPSPHRWHPFARIGLLLVVMSFHSFFAIALMNTQTVLADSYYRGLHRGYATGLLADQHLGAGISWALGEVPILLVIAAIFVQWVRSDHREAQRVDRAAERTGRSSELDSYNDYLARLAEADSRKKS
jgi:cytochrome c oxidase assembly factor CtaG